MTTSQTKNWKPEVAALIEHAYSIAGIDPQRINHQHEKAAITSINLMFADWIAALVPEWLKVIHTIPIDEDQQVYNLADDQYDNIFEGLYDIESAVILYRQQDPNEDQNIFNTMKKMTAKEFNEIRSNIKGIPNGFWFERREPPVLHVSYLPDTSYAMRMVCLYHPDVVLTKKELPDIPFRWHSAFTYGLAARLVEIFKANDLQAVTIAKDRAMQAFEVAYEGEGDGVNPEFQPNTFKFIGNF